MTLKLTEKDFWTIVGLCALVCVCYANVLGAPFVWDDEVIVKENPLIRSFSNLPQVFSAGIFGGTTDLSGFFRPLQTVSYMFDYRIWFLNPFGYHLTNVILHALNAVLVFFFVSRLMPKPAAILCAGFFAIHPVNTETVAYVSDRGDLLCFFLGMMGMNLYIRSERTLMLVVSAACVVAAALAKEQGIVFPLLMFLTALFFSKDEKRLTWASVLIVTAMGYAGIMFVRTLQASEQTLSSIANASFIDRAATVPYIIYEYLRLSILPHSLHMEYHRVVSAQSLDVLWYVLAVVIVVATLWRFAPRKQEALFWMLWAAIGVLPFLQIFKPLPSTVREHWLYLPLVGLLAVYAEIVGGLLQNEATKKKTLVGVALVAVAFMGFTVMRNHDWRDARKLYAHDVAMEPKSFLLWNNVGVEAFRRGAMQDAADAFSRAISAGAGARYAMAYNNLGYVYQLSKMPQQAEAMFVKSLQLSPSERAFLNLCGLYIDAGQVEAAEKVLIQGAQSLPQSKSIAENLARVRAYQAQRKAK